MKRLIPILILFVVALAPAAQATDPASYWNAWALFFTGADGKPSAVTPSNKLPVDAGLSSLASTSEGLKVVATGVVSITGVPDVTNPGISTATLYTGTLATDTVTLISSIVSLAANDIVEVQVRATAYRGPSDVASATLQEFGTKMAVDDTFTFRYNGADFGLIADPAAVSKYGLTVYKDH